MKPNPLCEITQPMFAKRKSFNDSKAWRQRLIQGLVFCLMSALLGCGGGSSSSNNSSGSQAATPALAANVVTQGNFSSGQQGAAYSITVTNNGNAASNGTVTVVDPPTGFTVTAINGTGWSCTLSTVTCTRTDTLAPGQSFPAIVVTGIVTASNGAPVTIPLSLSGGGMSSTVTSTPSATVIAPALSVTQAHTGNFNLGQQGATSTVNVKNGASAGATSAKVTVTETVPSGETLVSMSGSGWTCPGSGGANTCDRSDTLANGATYPAITVAVNVAANASSPQTSQASVSGGGMATPSSATDPATINMPDLLIAESHNGVPTDGGNGTFNISVSNVASGATAGPSGGAITVTDTLPAQFTFISAVANGWACGAAGQTVTCTNPGPINPGGAAATIPLTVGISSSASGTISNTATVASFGDTNVANNAASDSVTFAPDLAISESHSGDFGAGTDGALTLAINNVGNGLTTGAITITDTLPPQFTFVSANAVGWTCGAASQLVTCTNPGPAAAGASGTIPMIVAVSASAPTGLIANTATVSTAGDSNATNDSATDNIPVLGQTDLPESISLNVPGAGAGGVIYAGGNSVSIAMTVTNQGAGDTLTPALSLNGVACSTCGTLGTIVAGTPGNYTIAYTPPATLATATTVTLTVTSSLANSFPGTANFPVFPAGVRVVKMTGVPGGGGVKTLSARVFNDSSNAGLSLQLLGAGYACPPTTGGATICGTLSPTSAITGTTNTAMGTSGISFTQLNFTYTVPASVPSAPYDRPMILAMSNADPTQRAAINFMLIPNGVGGGIIGNGSRLSSALTGSAPMTISGAFGGDAGVNKTLAWSLTVNGADCQPTCGTLSAPTYIRNGNNVTATLTYTPPATVPAIPANKPVLTALSVDVINGIQQFDSVQFKINDGTCGTGNNGILNGQYAFLLKGGGPGLGYVALIGSFTADGNGNITSGLLDVNRTLGPTTGLSIVPAGSSYSIGPDNRGCLTLANSGGGQATYRFAVGNLDGSGHVTQGRIIRFDDNTGFGQRAQGFLMKQDPTAFASSANGNYVFGYEGVQNAGERLATVGLYHADGAGNLSNFNSDAVDGSGNVDTNDPNGSGTYTIDPVTGRGTGTVTIGGTSNTVLYVVSASEILSMTTDPMSPSTPIVSGENRKQAATAFTPTSLDNNAYVVYETAVGITNGEDITAVGQLQFTTNGADTGEIDINDGGTLNTPQAISDSLTMAANGRATNAAGNVVLYWTGTDSAVVLTADSTVPFGYVQQQTGGPFTNSSFSGLAFFGGGAATAGAEFDVGSANFDGSGGLTVNDDKQGPESGVGSESLNLSYALVPTTGKLTISSPEGALLTGFVISSSKIVFIPTSGAAQLFVGVH